MYGGVQGRPTAKRHSRKYRSCSTNLFIFDAMESGLYVRHIYFLLPMGFEIAQAAEQTSTSESSYYVLMKVMR